MGRGRGGARASVPGADGLRDGEVRVLPAEARRGSSQDRLASGSGGDAVHDEGRGATEPRHPSAARAARRGRTRRDRADPVLLRDDGHADIRRGHLGGSRDLERDGGPGLLRKRVPPSRLGDARVRDGSRIRRGARQRRAPAAPRLCRDPARSGVGHGASAARHRPPEARGDVRDTVHGCAPGRGGPGRARKGRDGASRYARSRSGASPAQASRRSDSRWSPSGTPTCGT